jgi:Mrp family chromosome partitioning ATPase
VVPQPVPKGWRADESLSPASRRPLCDELYPLAVQQCFVLAVSGVRTGAEDTARVATELALSLAETEHPRILLLEGNLQRPPIHRLMQIEMPLFAGFSEQLEARIQAGAERAPWNVLACSASLHVLAEGVMRIPELILSRQFEDCVMELRQYYDVIVISGPTVSEIAACRAVQDVVDGGVLVCPKGGTSEIGEASALFSQKRFSTVLATG